VFTARYALSPYIKQILFVFKGLMKTCGTEDVQLTIVLTSAAEDVNVQLHAPAALLPSVALPLSIAWEDGRAPAAVSKFRFFDYVARIQSLYSLSYHFTVSSVSIVKTCAMVDWNFIRRREKESVYITVSILLLGPKVSLHAWLPSNKYRYCRQVPRLCPSVLLVRVALKMKMCVPFMSCVRVTF
jgi:hypothetical protein